MSLTLEKTNNAIKRKISRIVQELSADSNEGPECIFVQFMNSKTYELLCDPESNLCFESNAYILDMFQHEIDNNWEEWLKI